MFDLAQTQHLFELAEVAPADRDEAWFAAFFPCVWFASLEVAASFRGPDTFPYLRMHLPRPAAPFASNSLGNVARNVVEQGLGVAVFASPEAAEPIFVFPMDMLGSMLEYDSWKGDPTDLEELARADRAGMGSGGLEEISMKAGQKVFVGSPASSFLAPYTARALFQHLRDGWMMAQPRIALLLNPGLVVSRNLVISNKLSEFPDRETAGRQARMLLWYLPPRRSLILMPEDWSEESMRPLTEFFPPAQQK